MIKTYRYSVEKSKYPWPWKQDQDCWVLIKTNIATHGSYPVGYFDSLQLANEVMEAILSVSYVTCERCSFITHVVPQKGCTICGGDVFKMVERDYPTAGPLQEEPNKIEFRKYF